MQTSGKFIGTGWAFPPAFTLGGEELVMVQDEQDIFESLQILLSTSLGERVLREDFGCNLQDYLFEELDNRLLANLRLAVKEAVQRHETRVNLEDISFDVDANLEMATIFIRIGFVVRTTNTRYNLVYPFYLREATSVPGASGRLAENVLPEIPPLTPADVMPRRTVAPDPEPETAGPVFESFQHRTSAENTNNWTANYTLLDHPALNGRPEALVFITPVWDTTPGKPEFAFQETDPFEVLFVGNRWAIGYRNAAVLARNLAFNVLVAPAGLPEAFVFTVSEGNRHPNLAWAFMHYDHAALQNTPGAFVLVTPRRVEGVYMNNHICLAYNTNNGWILINQIANDSEHPAHVFAVGEQFNVLVVPQNGRLGNLTARDQLVRADNLQHNAGTRLEQQTLPDGDGQIFFIPVLGLRGGPSYFKASLYAWFDHEGDGHTTWATNHWFICTTGGVALQTGALFFVFAVDQRP